MAKRGRPEVLDAGKRDQIVSIVSVGGTVAMAAEAVGCCPRTIYYAAERDEEFKKRIDLLIVCIRQGSTLRRLHLGFMHAMKTLRSDPWRFYFFPINPMGAMKRLYEAEQELKELLQQEDPFPSGVEGIFAMQRSLAELYQKANKNKQ